MATGLSLATPIRVLPCPNCSETINTSTQQCPSCGTTIDPAFAEQAAGNFADVNRACSDASYLKIMAGCAGVFFLLRFIPILGFVGSLGFFFLEFAIPFMSIRWWVKYGSITTRDREFHQAQSTALWMGIGSVAFFILYEGGSVLLRLYLASH